MWKHLIWLFAAVSTMLSAQSAADLPSFTSDEIAIYRSFLLHYPEQVSNMIGMQDTTVAFVAPTGFHEQPAPPSLKVPAYSGRKLPPQVLELTDEKEVTARIAAQGKLIDSAKRDPQRGPDGYVRTHLTLSEIAFDPQHELAAFSYSASCGCLGGQGGMVVYVRRHGRWRLRARLNTWEG